MKVIDSIPGKRTEFHKDDSEKTFTIRTVQDVNPILENNKALQTLNDGYSPSRELKRVASIPTTIVRKWCKDAGISFRDFLRRPQEFEAWLGKKLKDPENRFLLTAPFKRPDYKGILGLRDAVAEGRALGMTPKGQWRLFRIRVADWIYDLRPLLKRADEWLFYLQARVRN